MQVLHLKQCRIPGRYKYSGLIKELLDANILASQNSLIVQPGP